MGLSRDPGAARKLVGDRACPLCGEQAWDFEGSRVVFLVKTRARVAESPITAEPEGRTSAARILAISSCDA